MSIRVKSDKFSGFYMQSALFEFPLYFCLYLNVLLSVASKSEFSDQLIQIELVITNNLL
jgi:hypothetical protein